VLALEVIADELATEIVLKLESGSDIGGYRPKYPFTPWRIAPSASNRVLCCAVAGAEAHGGCVIDGGHYNDVISLFLAP